MYNKYHKKYYETHKAAIKQHSKEYYHTRVKNKKKKTPMEKLSSQQARFKHALEKGLPIEEAITRAWPNLLTDTQINAKLKQLEKNRYLEKVIDVSQQKYLERLNNALDELKIDKKDILSFIADKEIKMMDKVDGNSPPAIDRVAAVVLDGVKKDIGLRVEKSESKALNLNWDMTEEEKKVMKGILKGEK